MDDYSSHSVELSTRKIHLTDKRTAEILNSPMSRCQLEKFTENLMAKIGKDMADETEKDLISGKLRLK
jgi:hypothetical protein